MRREEALNRLREHRTEVERLGVSRLALFGSVARDEAREDSDIDVLVEFSQPVGLFEFLRLDFYLEELLGSHVDLVTPDALKAKMRERILHEAIYAT
jgi:predicted nucleotidyltransferase